MITHEYHQTKMKGRHILLWDFLVPLLLISGVAYFLDRKYWHPLLQGIVDLPLVGLPFYKSRMFVDYVHWHYLIFWAPIFLLSFAVSFRTARIPGPGRAVLRWWQGLLQLKVKKDVHVETFPPLFNRQHAAILRFIDAVEDKESHSRVLGFYKRFPSDLARETGEGKVPEKATDFLPIIISEEERYRHIQVIGGSGSGKSASVLAPMLLGDAAESDLATLTINPKADLYLLKILADGVRKAKKKGGNIPTAVISFSRKDSLSYDPLLYGDADALTKKIIGSSEINHPFYRAFQETWLMSFFRVFKTEALLVDRLMLRHLYHYLTKPTSLLDEIRPLCKSENNLRRLSVLAAAKPESLAGVASHVSLLVEDESLAHIFDNPKGRLLNVKDILQKGGNIFIEVDTSSKGPQGRALGRMIMMEVQLLAGARQSGYEPKGIGVQVYLEEFASFAYNGSIDLLDKCRSARIGLMLSHQSLGNLQRDALSRSFKDEVVDNCHTKFFLSLQDETAEWASRQLGTRKVVKKSLTISHNTGRTDNNARENHTLAFREELEPYVEPSDFNLGVGNGFAILENRQGQLIKGPISLGYVDENDLCSDEELFVFLREAYQNHPLRPRGGSLIDNDTPPGDAVDLMKDIPLSALEETDGGPNSGLSTQPRGLGGPAKDAPEPGKLAGDKNDPPERLGPTDDMGRDHDY